MNQVRCSVIFLLGICLTFIACPDTILSSTASDTNPPTVQAITPVHGTQASWTWTEVPNAIAYRCSLNPDNTAWIELGPETLSYTKAGLTAGSYTLFVQAKSLENQWSLASSATVSVEPIGDTRIRLMAANLTSGNFQNYDQGAGIRIMQGVKPDVVMVQEFNYKSNSEADLQFMANAVMGGSAYYFRESDAQIPNGIISRYPILSSGEWDDTSATNRNFSWACIDIPGSVDLYAVSINLLTTNSTVRDAQAQSLVAYIAANVPPNTYLVIAGTLNTGSFTEICYTTLSPTVITSGPYSVSPDGIQGTNSARTKPYDGVYADSDLTALMTPVTIRSASYAAGLVVDTRTYPTIADLTPALATDSGASNMQHMGVVRDYLVPGD